MIRITPDPATDLELVRVYKAPVELVWRCWTEPELLKKWFCPKPWQVTEAEIDLRPGGIFRTKMEGPMPDSETLCDHDSAGCWLVVEPHRHLAFTDCLGPGFRPKDKSFMTAILDFETVPEGTKVTAWALHSSEAMRKQHEEMGFDQGWNAAADQLVELLESLKESA